MDLEIRGLRLRAEPSRGVAYLIAMLVVYALTGAVPLAP
jgi:hypothetical protein